MRLLDTIAQAITYMEYKPLGYLDAVSKYQLDLEYDTFKEAEGAFFLCYDSYLDLSFDAELTDSQITTLNNSYQLEG